MTTRLVPVPAEDKQVVVNLMQLCQHDCSEFDGDDVNRHGLYGYPWLDHYWTEPDRYPFLITLDDRIVGFALVRDRTESGGESVPHSIAEFFVLRKYRRRGVGRTAARQVFASLPPGRWVVEQSLRNAAAQAFWRSVIGECTEGRFSEHRDPDHNVMEFSTGTEPGT